MSVGKEVGREVGLSRYVPRIEPGGGVGLSGLSKMTGGEVSSPGAALKGSWMGLQKVV